MAAGLCFLGELARRRARVRAGLLLTRAEEVGFAGMLEAAHAGWLDRRATYLNLECFSARAGAAMGGGPIVRVGEDRALTRFAGRIAARRRRHGPRLRETLSARFGERS